MLYELALFEYGLTPDYLNEYWTEEMLVLIFKARAKRLGAQQKQDGPKLVGNSDFFANAGITVEKR